MVHAPDGNATYVVEKPLGGTNFVHSVRRVSDGELFIAKEFNADIVPELVGLRQETRPDNIVAFEAAARVLNHENLISVVKSMWTAPVVPVSKGGVANEWSVVYEWCAKGTLKEILDHPAMEPTAQGFLPEGLVWHVTLSILRALAFLHEGKRERVVLSEDGLRLERTWYCLDDDWMPILHRAIEPENIHFQARKGKESYGLCKLGNFSRCYVSGLARDPADDNSQEVLATFNNLAQPDPKQEEVRAWWAQAHADGEQPNWRGQMPVSGCISSIPCLRPALPLADIDATIEPPGIHDW
jgi:serine/threonine protein kinase